MLKRVWLILWKLFFLRTSLNYCYFLTYNFFLCVDPRIRVHKISQNYVYKQGHHLGHFSLSDWSNTEILPYPLVNCCPSPPWGPITALAHLASPLTPPWASQGTVTAGGAGAPGRHSSPPRSQMHPCYTTGYTLWISRLLKTTLCISVTDVSYPLFKKIHY